MAGGSPLCLAGRLIGFGKETDRILADCWLVDGSVFFYCKIQTIKLTVFFSQLAGGSPLCLAGRWSVDWFWQRDWQNVGWLLIGGWLGVFYCKMETKYWRVFFSSWLNAWLAAPLFALLVGGRLIGFGKETDRILADCWLVDGSVFFTAKFRLKNWRVFFLAVDLLHGCGSPLCLAGRWSVDWFWQKDWQNVGWLLVGGWLSVFLLQNSDYKTDGFFLAVDRLHGWRLPSLLSWSLVGWLVLAKRLTEYWLTVGWWMAQCFFTAKFRL